MTTTLGKLGSGTFGAFGSQDIAPAKPKTPEETRTSLQEDVMKAAKAESEMETAQKKEKLYGEQEMAGAELATKEQYAKERVPEDLKAKLEKHLDEQSKPFVPTKETTDDLTALFVTTNLLGFLVGGRGKNNAQAAMSAMNGMLEGHQKGRDDLYKKEKDIFDENQKVLSKSIEQLRNELKDAAETAAVDSQLGIAKARDSIAKHGFTTLMPYLEKQGLVPTYKLAEQAYKMNEDNLARQQKLEEKAASAAHVKFEEEQALKRGVREEKKLGIDFTRLRMAEDKAKADAGQLTDTSINDAAQAIANYSQSPPGLRDKLRNLILAKVRVINPAYNENEYKTTGAAERYWTTGQGTKQLQSFNTVAGHLSSLEEYAKGLQNGDARLANRGLNYLQTEFGANNVTNFNTAKQIVATEIINTITKSGGGVKEREEASANFSAANSPEQLQGAIDVAKELIKGRLDASKQQYETGTGKKDFDKFLTDDAKRSFSRTTTPAAQVTPRREFSTLEEAMAANLPSGTKIKVSGRNATVE